jgi:hypothetical protein
MMPYESLEAARRILARAGGGAFGPGDALLLAAASALAGKDDDGPMTDPARALVAACGLRGASPDHLDLLTAAVPPLARPTLLADLEPLLARIDPAWAWELIRRLLDDEETLRHGTLGLGVAARLGDEAEARTLLASKVARNGHFARQLAADASARRREDVFARLEEGTLGPVHMLLPSECRSYLVAAALVNPKRALGLADAMLETVPPQGLAPALLLLTQTAAREGLGGAVRERARREDFITLQATWTESAAAAGALSGRALVEHVRELAPRVADELDPGRELLAGLPLVMALAHGGAAEALSEQAVEWRLPPPLLADQAFQAGLRLPASVLDPLLAVPEQDWSGLFPWDYGWWRDTATKDTDRRLACEDVLQVAANLPWRPLPGSLADACHWPVSPTSSVNVAG